MRKGRKALAVLLLAATACLSVSAQRYYTKAYPKSAVKEAVAWLKDGSWRQGFTAADADKGVNVAEFRSQYLKNPRQWTALFHWLAATDLLAIPKGKHPIEGSSLVASVEDSHNEPLEKRRSESHYHHIDFQYVVRGTERFALLDHLSSKPNTMYRPDVIRYDYDVENTKFIDSRNDRFLIFFPCDWHIAKIKTDKDDQNIRVIVVKLDYVE